MRESAKGFNMKRIVFLVFMFFSTLAVAEWTWVVTTDEGDKFYIDLDRF
jgi:hypothetical protein